MRVYFRDYNKIFSSVGSQLRTTRSVEKSDLIVSSSENYRDKPIIIFQHGRIAVHFKKQPQTHYLVWGMKDKRRLIRRGAKKKFIHVTGCLLFNYLKPRKKHKGINIVYAPLHNEAGHAYFINRDFRDELRKIKGVNIITKLLRMQKSHSWKYDNVICSDRDTRRHYEICADVLSIADLVVTIEEGTFALLAQYLDIPVISCNSRKDYRREDGRLMAGDKRFINGVIEVGSSRKQCVFSPAVKRVDLKRIKTLPEVIMQQLRNPAELKEERVQACIDYGGADIKNPIKETLNIIKKIYDEYRSSAKN